MASTKIRFPSQGKVDGDIDLNFNKIINLDNPSSNADAANKAYVDSVAQGLDVKESVRVIADTEVTKSGLQTIDGVLLVDGDRVLLVSQGTVTDTANNNGIWIAHSSAWTRALDFDPATPGTVSDGAFTFVEEGSVYEGSGWVLYEFDTGTQDELWSQFSGAGQITAGSGLTKSGNTLDVGSGDGIQINPDSIEVKLDGTTLSKSAAGLKVAPAGINSLELNNGIITNIKVWSGAAIDTTKLADGSVINSEFQNLSGSNENIQSALDIRVHFDQYRARETPTGTINGSNTVFTLASTPYSGSEMVFLNGILQDAGAGNDYTISGNTITFINAPVSGDKIKVTYLQNII